MATVAELLVKISGDSSGLRKEIAATQRQINKAFGSKGMEFSNAAITGVEAFTAALGLAGVAAIKCAADIETMTTAFSTLLGSADAGNAMTKQLQDLALITPYTTEQLGKGARQMLAYGFAAKDIPGLLVNIGNASSALGLGAEGMQRITMALGQMGAKGTVQADEMRQLAEAGIPSWKALADTMGVTIPEAMDAVEKRTVSSATGINAVLGIMNSKFGGGMEAQSKTIAGSISNIIDSMQLFGGAIGQAINKFTGLSEILQSAGNYIAAFTRIVQSGGIGEAIKQLVPPSVILAFTTLGGIIAAVAVPALYSMAAAAVAALVPFAPLIAAGVALGVVAFEIVENWQTVGPLFQSVFGLLSTLVSGAYDAVTTVFSAIVYSISGFMENILDMVTTVFGGIYDVVASIFDGIVGLGGSLVEGISGVIPGVSEVFRSVFGDTIYNTVASVVQSMTDLFSQFVNWLSSKLSGVLTFASNVYNSVAGVIGAAKSTDWGNIKLGFSAPDIKSTVANILPNTKVAAVTNPDLSNFGAGDATGKGDKKGASKAAKEAAQVVKAEADYEIDVQKNKAKIIQALVKDELADLDRERKNGLSGIREYWASREKEDTDGLAQIQSYWDKRGKLESQGVQAELDALNAEKLAVQNQMDQTSDPSDSINLKKKMLDIDTQIVLKERELVEVSKKNTQQAKEEAAAYIEKYAALMKSTRESMKSTGWTNYLNSLHGSSKDLAGFDKDKEDSLKAVQDIVDNYKLSLAKMNADHHTQALGSIKIDEWAAKQREQINKNSQDEINRYYAQGKKLQADLEEARNKGSLSEYMSFLNSQESLLRQSLEGRQALIDAQADLWKKANHSVFDDMASMFNDVSSSLTDILSDFMHGTKSAGDVFRSFAGAVLDSIIKIQAQAMAARITSGLSGLFGGLLGGSSGSSSGSSGGYNLTTPITSILNNADGGSVFGAGTGTSDSILSWLSNGEYVFTANATKAIGVSNLDYMNQTGKLPGYATGGLVTGASLSSISGNYANVAPTTKNNSGQAPNIKVNINNYGNAKVETSQPQYDANSKSYILNVVIDAIKNNTAVRNVVRSV